MLVTERTEMQLVRQSSRRWRFFYLDTKLARPFRLLKGFTCKPSDADKHVLKDRDTDGLNSMANTPLC